MSKGYKILILAALAGLVLWQVYRVVFGSGSETDDSRQAAVAVALSPVRKMTINDIGLFTGSLQPRSQFIAAPKIYGRLEKVLVNIGDKVSYNQLIAEIDDDEYAQQAEKARAELEVIRATLEETRSSMEVARREFGRVKALYSQEIASEADYDMARASFTAQEARYKVALARVAEREAAWKEAQVRLSYTRIRASWEEGERNAQYRVVGERFKDEGAMLTPNTPIVSILDINLLIAVIHVIERDYPKVRVGMEAEITTDAFPGRTFTGRIVRIAPLLKETSRQARVEVEIANLDHLLKPGMFIRASLVYGQHENATVIPVVALSRRNGKQGVFLAEEQKTRVRFIPVNVGIVNGELAELLEPEISGSVVSLGQHLLEDGAPIIATEEID